MLTDESAGISMVSDSRGDEGTRIGVERDLERDVILLGRGAAHECCNWRL